MFIVNKSVFTSEELAQYEALIAKAKVDPEAGQDEMEDDMPPFPPKKKTAVEDPGVEKSASPELKKAMERLESLEKSMKMDKFSEIAKKYAPLGEKPEDLAKSLYAMSESSPENYDAYIAVLEKSLGYVEKSGVFSEIGKSFSGGGSTVDKVGAIANEIMKSDASMTRDQAIAKAWIDHPELVAEYDKEYQA